MRRILPLFLILPLSFAVACGDSEGDADTGVHADAQTQQDASTSGDSGIHPDASTNPDAGSPADTGTPTDSGTPVDSGTPTDSGTPVDAGEIPDAGTSTSGACTNTADQMTIDTVGEAALTTSTRDCFVGCIADPMRVNCTAQCITDATAISLGCTTCFSARAECAIANCAAAGCISDPSSQACMDCQVQNNCVSDFATCSGL